MSCDIYCDFRMPRNSEFFSETYPHSHLVITRPDVKEYIVRARPPGARRYDIIGRTDSRAYAYQLLAETMDAKRRVYKRGDILASEGPMSYYDPHRIVEMVRDH